MPKILYLRDFCLFKVESIDMVKKNLIQVFDNRKVRVVWGNEIVTNCNGLKMFAPDGKMRMTDVADTEQLFRLIPSIPSPLTSLVETHGVRLNTQNIEYFLRRTPCVSTRSF